MATTDVVTYAVSGLPVNATVVTSCFRTGEYSSATGIYETSYSYEQLETLYTDRFDDVYYYVQSG